MHVLKARGGVEALIDLTGSCNSPSRNALSFGGRVEQDFELRPLRDFEIFLDRGSLAKFRDDGSGCERGVLSMNCGGHEEKEGGQE